MMAQKPKAGVEMTPKAVETLQDDAGFDEAIFQGGTRNDFTIMSGESKMSPDVSPTNQPAVRSHNNLFSNMRSGTKVNSS